MAHRGRPHGASPTARDDKVCVSCGRRIQWRAKWSDSWDEVRYCSDACRRRGVSAADLRLEADILGALTSRSAVSIDTVDAAAPDPEPARRAARRLVARREVELIQSGRVVDPSTAKGVFQIRKI